MTIGKRHFLNPFHWNILIFISFLGLGVFTARRFGKDTSETLQTSNTSKPSPDLTHKNSYSNSPNKSHPSKHSEASLITAGPLEAPSKSALSEEVAKDVHSTPQSLLLFAEKMAPQMEAALQNVNSAKVLFPKLADCVTTNQNDFSMNVRALCLANIERISTKYPSEFADSYSNFIRDVPSNLQSIAGVSEKDSFGRRQP